MGQALRYIISAVAGAFLAMFFEPFFSALFATIGVDTSAWAGPVVTGLGEIIALEWFRLLGAGFIGAAAGMWLHFAATKFDRRRQTKKAGDVSDAASEADRREHEFMAEERARRRFAAADEVTRIRTILVDKSTTREEKKQAFHGTPYHSDMFLDDDLLADAWEEFYSACNDVFREWIKWADSPDSPEKFFREHNLNRAIGTLNQKASSLISCILLQRT